MPMRKMTPRRRVAKKAYRRRLRYRRRAKAPSTVSIRTPSVVPDRLFTKLKYSLSRTLDTSPASSNPQYVFRGNSLYDPEFAVGGSQPMGYDQWSAFYNNYRVHASAITVRMMSTADSDAGGFIKVTLFPSTTAAAGSYSGNSEQPYSKVNYLPNKGLNKIFLKNKMYAKKMLGLKSIAYDEDLAAAIGADPVKEWYWILDAYSINEVANVLGVYMEVKITYYAEFFGRVQLARS